MSHICWIYFTFITVKRTCRWHLEKKGASTKNVGGHIQNGPIIGLFHLLEPGSSATLVLVPTPSQFNLLTSQEPLCFSTNRLGSHVGRPLYALLKILQAHLRLQWGCLIVTGAAHGAIAPSAVLVKLSLSLSEVEFSSVGTSCSNNNYITFY